MGRPQKELTPEQMQELETLAAVMTMGQIADYFGIGRTTMYAIIERDPEVSERYKKGKSKAVSNVANSLIKRAMEGCTTSAIFFLKTQAGWKETTVVEHDGKVTHSVDPKTLTREERNQLISIYESAAARSLESGSEEG